MRTTDIIEFTFIFMFIYVILLCTTLITLFVYDLLGRTIWVILYIPLFIIVIGLFCLKIISVIIGDKR